MAENRTGCSGEHELCFEAVRAGQVTLSGAVRGGGHARLRGSSCWIGNPASVPTHFPTPELGRWLAATGCAHTVAFLSSLGRDCVWPWAEGGLPSVPHPWAMDFQETGWKLTIIASLPCGTFGCQAILLPRQLPAQARLYRGDSATPTKLRRSERNP